MNERSYTFDDDKTGWGDGPWQTEPDKIVWIDDATGLDCMIVRNPYGALCGYVGVPPGHPWWGVGYGDIDAEVHGGLTFAAPCEPGKREDEHAICHTTRPGRPADVWWLGFDCAHGFDVMPAMRAFLGPIAADERHGEYRDVAYVKTEVASLAWQAADA